MKTTPAGPSPIAAYDSAGCLAGIVNPAKLQQLQSGSTRFDAAGNPVAGTTSAGKVVEISAPKAPQ